MAACFPFVESFARLDNALWGVFHCRDNKALAGALTSLWEIWSLHPKLHHRVLTTRSALLKVVIVRVLRAVSACSATRRLPIDQLARCIHPCTVHIVHSRLTADILVYREQHTLLQLLQSIVSGSILLHRFTKQLDAGVTIEQAQNRFSEFTSGWKLCAELCEVLACCFIYCQEFSIDCLGFRAPQDQIDALSVVDDGTCSVVSVRTSRSVASSKYSTAKSTARFELKRAHYQSAIARDVIPEDGANIIAGEKFKLKTLEEHRYATRFQEKKVTPKTWRSVLREAHKLVQSGDRINLAAALYLLLEIIWLDPRGCNLATMYLDTGSIYLEFDHLEEAAKAYRNSVRLDPSNWKARYNLGVATSRLLDFVEATRQLKLALKACPEDIAEEINSILEEIRRIQCAKNLRAFNETKRARTFTTQYLESLHFASEKLGVSKSRGLQDDHTVSYRNGLALSSSTPQLLDASHEWQGSVASLLHRLHTVAWCRHLRIQDEILRLDPTRAGGISVRVFEEVARRITGAHLRATERKDLANMLGNDGTIIFHFLAPNPESSKALDEMQNEGVCHSLLDWNLYRKRAKRSAKSREGGLWYWLDCTMANWIKVVLPQLSGTEWALLIMALADRGWLTPMDFAWKWRCLPEPDDLSMLQLADRGTFIYECHRVRCLIEEEASRTIQMLARRYMMNANRRNSIRLQTQHFCHQGKMHEAFLLEDVHTRLAKDTSFDQEVAREVLQCIEALVDNLIVSNRQEQKMYEDEVRWQDIPVRTEQRQKIISAIGAVQSTARSNEATRRST